MSNAMVALFVAAGVGGFVYSKLGRRVGYGNTREVWIIIGVCFAAAFFFVYSLLTWVLHAKTH